MSVYVPTDWVNNTTPSINARNLNHLEAGIETAHQEISDIVSGATSVANATEAERALTVDPATETSTGGAKIWVDSADPANIVGFIDAR